MLLRLRMSNLENTKFSLLCCTRSLVGSVDSLANLTVKFYCGREMLS